jgi:hypothetical protein
MKLYLMFVGQGGVVAVFLTQNPPLDAYDITYRNFAA